MKKGLKVASNLVIFLLITGFVWFMASSVNNDNLPGYGKAAHPEEPFESMFTQIASFDLPVEINRFELHNDKLFISAGEAIYIYDTQGELLKIFSVEPEVRDIAVDGELIYLLYPTSIAVYLPDGQLFHQWEACSELSDYCSFTIAGDAVFVTDAENKDICKYTTEGNLVKFIKSPRGFIIPSYSFDIDSWNDTIYCVNSGRHLIESYTLDGDFIADFGAPGSEAGSFAGCCNPVYISFAPCGSLLTSEKGNPRVSCFERSGKFKELRLNSKMLGGGAKACEAKAMDDKLYVAVKDKISVFQCDKATASACSGCPAACPFRIVNN